MVTRLAARNGRYAVLCLALLLSNVAVSANTQAEEQDPSPAVHAAHRNFGPAEIEHVAYYPPYARYYRPYAYYYRPYSWYYRSPYFYYGWRYSPYYRPPFYGGYTPWWYGGYYRWPALPPAAFYYGPGFYAYRGPLPPHGYAGCYYW